LILAWAGFLLAGCTSPQQSPPVEINEVDIGILPADVDVATAAALADSARALLVDVRQQLEYDQGHIPGVRLIPLGELKTRYQEIPKDTTVILTCRSGRRSARAAEFLREQGYDNIHNMAGGILAWKQAGYRTESK
jgi:rhodanese-related sulfurtransferase